MTEFEYRICSHGEFEEFVKNGKEKRMCNLCLTEAQTIKESLKIKIIPNVIIMISNFFINRNKFFLLGDWAWLICPLLFV